MSGTVHSAGARRVLLVDDDPNILGALGELFELTTPVRALGFSGLAEVIANAPAVLDGSVVAAIVDINLGVGFPSGIDVYHWLGEQGFRGEIVFLTGHAKNDPLVRKATELENVKVFEKPMDVDKLISMVEEWGNDQPEAHRALA